MCVAMTHADGGGGRQSVGDMCYGVGKTERMYSDSVAWSGAVNKGQRAGLVYMDGLMSGDEVLVLLGRGDESRGAGRVRIGPRQRGDGQVNWLQEAGGVGYDADIVTGQGEQSLLRFPFSSV